MKNINNKAQEEMVGFVLIVVLVAVIFLIFMGIAFRQAVNTPEKQSKDVSEFLDSVMQYTTECSLNYAPSDIGDLMIKYAEDNTTKCVNTEDSAGSILENDLKGIFSASWNIGSQSNYKGYIFSSYLNLSQETELISISEGNCSGNYIVADSILPSNSGTIISSFKLCS